MRKLAHALVIAVALAASALFFGFVLFSTRVMREQVIKSETADGIVVLTGGEDRIQPVPAC